MTCYKLVSYIEILIYDSGFFLQMNSVFTAYRLPREYLKWSTDETKLIVIVSVTSNWDLRIPQGLLILFLSSYFYKEMLGSFPKFSTMMKISARTKNLPVLS